MNNIHTANFESKTAAAAVDVYRSVCFMTLNNDSEEASIIIIQKRSVRRERVEYHQVIVYVLHSCLVVFYTYNVIVRITFVCLWLLVWPLWPRKRIEQHYIHFVVGWQA